MQGRTGEPRRAGFEFELGNLPVTPTATRLQSVLGGELEVRSPFEAILRNSSLGQLSVERDADILRSTRYRRWLAQLGVAFTPGTWAHDIETNIDRASRMLIPCEVVTEPIAFDDLYKLDELGGTLQSLGAEGTQDSLIYAFGLHINPSIPDEDAGTLRRYIQSFLLLSSWIIEYSDTDLTRRFLTKFIDPYPPDYMELILDTAYDPDLGELIDHYLWHNPTRNRALDMLPVFCTLDEARVRAALDEDENRLVKGRPAFHYRLPDCRINVPGWSVALPWNQWVYIEKLAQDEGLLAELIDAWRFCNRQFTLTPERSWIDYLTSLMTCKFFER